MKNGEDLVLEKIKKRKSTAGYIYIYTERVKREIAKNLECEREGERGTTIPLRKKQKTRIMIKHRSEMIKVPLHN